MLGYLWHKTIRITWGIRIIGVRIVGIQITKGPMSLSELILNNTPCGYSDRHSLQYISRFLTPVRLLIETWSRV